MLFFKNLSHSLREASSCLALPRGSSISVMGGCGGLRHVPVNFNHIKLSRPLSVGMSALYFTPPHSAVEPQIAF